jgi:RecB family exonuclease
MAENSISYSQFSMYLKCPKQWEQEYALNKREFSQSIHTIFGTSVHEVIQDWLSVCYTKTAKEADEMNLNEDLKQKIAMHYGDAVKKTGEHFSTALELQEFWQDGVAILDYIKRNRAAYFSSRNEELLGIETQLLLPLSKNIIFKGFIDLILRDKRTGRIRIIDLKTSTAGWNKYQKADKTKTAQLILYKEFYGKQYNVDPEMIDVEYIILRRKINEDGDFPLKRIQTFSPASGKPSRNKVGTALVDFIDKVFNEDGTYNLDAEYPAIASSACKYCKYKDDKSVCPAAKRLKK